MLRRILNLRKALQACWSGVAGRHAAHSIRILRSSAIFDAVWYKEHYQDLRGTSVDAVRHYVVHGVREGRNPHPLSDTRWYLEQNTDVAASDTNPLVHYILYGAKEGRDPHPVFNTARYIDHHPDIDFTAINPLQHCINLYHAHKRNGHSSISTEGIMWAKAAFAIEHDFTEGKWSYSQVRATILSAFDASYYVSKNHQTYSMDAIDHFVTVGWRHGYDPSPHFSVTHYLSLNPDVGTAGCNPLYHFIMWGRSEGRSSKPARKRHILASNKLAPILFVGHEGIKTGAPVVLLEIIRWYARHTRRPIAVLLMGGGRLASSYAEYADVFVFHSDMHESLNSTAFAAFINRPFVVAYVNSVASGDFHIVYDRFLRERNVPLVLHVHELSNVIREYFDKFTELRARAASFIAASNKVKTCLIDEFGCDASKIFLSHSFIRAIAVAESDVGLFREKARRQLGLGSADFAILGCGTVHERKGPDLFIDTAAKLVASGLVPNARFIWIGDGAEFEQYCSATRDPMLSGRVQFVGFRDDASELLAAADVFYLSSREDPFPLVCLEAAQFAVPSLYFEGATGISEFAGSDAGIGIPPFDTGKVCTTLCSLAQHPVALMRLGQAARARVIAGYMAETKIGQIARHVQNVTRFAPDVSVIVPAYNHANYIHERISSILSVCPKSS